ncbi:MAG TPA: nucleotidyltransferase [Candidatus Limnocylindria bacterium]|nr:nucleotidyltransferase [Candidatus Limnocylindria bacterium]
MCAHDPVPKELTPEVAAFYGHAIERLRDAGVPFLVGGAYALERYTGIERHTKDADLFLRRRDIRRALDALARAGYRTELTFPHWLGKARDGGEVVDLIFSSGNGIARVDELWFAHARDADILGVPVKVIPPEEMIWSKAFVMERERFDGADIAHVIRATAEDLDWDRLLRRFGAHYRVLLTHLVLFGFVYPSERARVPARVMRDLLGRLDRECEASGADAPVCQGTLLSREQFLVDVARWAYTDARTLPPSGMTDGELDVWTKDIAS